MGKRVTPARDPKTGKFLKRAAAAAAPLSLRREVVVPSLALAPVAPLRREVLAPSSHALRVVPGQADPVRELAILEQTRAHRRRTHAKYLSNALLCLGLVLFFFWRIGGL